VLLAALVTAVTDVVGGDALLVYVEHHGRAPLFPDVDVSRTVGWFTTVFPLQLRIAAGGRAVDTLDAVARRLRAVPDAGIGFGVLRSGMHDDTAARELSALAQPEVSMNYLGRIDPPADARWRPAREARGREVGVGGTRPTLVDVAAWITTGELRIEWAYDARLLRRTTLEELTTRFAAAVDELALAGRRRRPDVPATASVP
jgi:non-ribosomal peptide synthase protein (TIGR01720 family)